MRKFTKQLFFTFLISFYFLKIEKVHSIVPYYYFPSVKNLEKESLSLGKNAYQLLYFGLYQDSLNLAKLAVKINSSNVQLLLILSETQVANELYKEALISLNKAEKINPKNSEIYFAKSNIYLKVIYLSTIDRFLFLKYLNLLQQFLICQKCSCHP